MLRTFAILFTGLCIAATAFAEAPGKVDAKTELAMQLMVVTNVDRTMQQMADQVPAMMEKQFESYGSCPASSAVVREMSAKMGEKVTSVLKSDAMKIDIASVYAEVFSEDELRETIAFYKSPLGHKLLERMPELMQKSMQISQDRMKDVMPELQKLGEQYDERIREAAATCGTADTTGKASSDKN
jgi:hypothetical protein